MTHPIPFSNQYKEEQAVKAQITAIDQYQASQSPRLYGGGLLPSSLSSGNGSGVGMGGSGFNVEILPLGSGLGNDFVLPIDQFIPPPPSLPGDDLVLPGDDLVLPGDDLVLPKYQDTPRPVDPSEIASKNPPLITNLTKQVFEKNKFEETVDITFSQLGVQNQVDPSFFDVSLATLEDFWILYDQFFYDIPKDGDTNSHTYLAITSGEYANYEFIQEQIQELLDEIAEIRTENVDLRIKNINLTLSSEDPKLGSITRDVGPESVNLESSILGTERSSIFGTERQR